MKYSGDLNGGALLLRESRVISELLLDGVSFDELEEHAIQKNILQKKSTATTKRFIATIKKRLIFADDSLLEMIAGGDDELSSQCTFYCVLKTMPIFVDFINRHLEDAYIEKEEVLKKYDWLEFLKECEQISPNIASWKETTRQRMGYNVFSMLAQVGFIESVKNPMLQHVIVRPELVSYLALMGDIKLLRCLEVSKNKTVISL